LVEDLTHRHGLLRGDDAVQRSAAILDLRPRRPNSFYGACLIKLSGRQTSPYTSGAIASAIGALIERRWISKKV
jgi:hypothetical protein